MDKPFYTLSGLDPVPNGMRRAFAAIGNFDGFHRGHQTIIDTLKAQAAAAGVPAILITFEPHPRDVFAPAPFMFRLTEGPEKQRLAQALGLDGVAMLTFNRQFAVIEAEVELGRLAVLNVDAMPMHHQAGIFWLKAQPPGQAGQLLIDELLLLAGP